MAFEKKIRPEIYCSEYLASKNWLKTTPPKIIPTSCIIGDQHHKLFESKLDLQTADKKLTQAREFLKQKRVELDSEWRNLEIAEKAFETQFQICNQVILSNLTKEKRAASISKDCEITNSKRNRDLHGSLMELEQLIEIKNRMTIRLKEMEKYENYLSTVVDEDNSFTNLSDIITRYDMLMEAKLEIMKHSEKSFVEFDMKNKEALAMVTKNDLDIENLYAKLNMLRSRFELASQETKRWAKNLNQLLDEIYTNLHTTDHLLQSIQFTYTSLCKFREIKADSKDYIEQFNFIKVALKFLQQVESMSNKNRKSKRSKSGL